MSLSKVLLGQGGSAAGLLIVLWLNQTLLQLLMSCGESGKHYGMAEGGTKGDIHTYIYTVCVYIYYVYHLLGIDVLMTIVGVL